MNSPEVPSFEERNQEISRQSESLTPMVESLLTGCPRQDTKASVQLQSSGLRSGIDARWLDAT